MRTFDMRRKMLGVLWVLYGILCFIEVAWIAVEAGTLTVMWGALLDRVPNPYSWMTLFHAALLIAVIVLVLAGIFALIAGGALLARSRSRRSMTLVAGFFGLVTGPLGLALGVYTLVLLLPRVQDESYRMAAAA
jgi:hypothetical protein